jgi:pSer/pThr/pTyr-binding forkhead associated (FHA) protein
VHKLEDLGSINGSFVNNSRIKKNEPQPLKAGDEVRFGRVQVTFLEAER